MRAEEIKEWYNEVTEHILNENFKSLLMSVMTSNMDLTKEEILEKIKIDEDLQDFEESRIFLDIEQDEVKDKTNDYKHNMKLALLKASDIQYKSLGQGVHNDFFYYGTTILQGKKKLNAIVTSDKRILVDWDDKEKEDEIQQEGIVYNFSFFKDALNYYWNSQDIEDYLENKYVKWRLEDLYNELFKINKKFVVHTDERIHSLVACDIISTYCYQLFETKGRVYFNADKNSGKTTQCQLYNLLAFNPVFSANLSAPSIDRIVESTCSTIIVDNFDTMNEEQKIATIQTYQTGYKKGMKTVKVGQKFIPETFNPYSPFVLNNVVGLDEVSLSRSIAIRMMRSDDKRTTGRKMNPKDKIYRKLRQGLHTWVLDNWVKVKDIYEKLDVYDMEGRNLEKSVSILAIAKLINDEVYNDIITYLKENIEQDNVRDMSDSWELAVWEYLFRQAGEKQAVSFDVAQKEIADDIQKMITIYDMTDSRTTTQVKIEHKKLSRYIGKLLNSIPKFKKFMSMGFPKFRIETVDLYNLVRTKNLLKHIDPTIVVKVVIVVKRVNPPFLSPSYFDDISELLHIPITTTTTTTTTTTNIKSNNLNDYSLKDSDTKEVETR
jgi:hypothetical protein